MTERTEHARVVCASPSGPGFQLSPSHGALSSDLLGIMIPRACSEITAFATCTDLPLCWARLEGSRSVFKCQGLGILHSTIRLTNYTLSLEGENKTAMVPGAILCYEYVLEGWGGTRLLLRLSE